MWLEPISHWVIVMAVLGQSPGTTPPTLPEPIVTQQSVFAIPFRVDPTNDPTKQVVEVQLYVSNDRGQQWHQYAKAPPTQQKFMFRAGEDGEYWFAIRTLDRSGQAKPESITSPGLCVRVDAKAPDAAASQTPTAASSAEKPMVSVNPAIGDEPKGSVAIAINPAYAKKFVTSNKRQDTAAAETGLPPGERPRMVNSRLFELEYDVDSVGPSGIGRVELWGTRDYGKTWSRFTQDNGKRGPLLVHVDEEGIYGFRVVVTNGAGFGGKPPASGDLPDLWVGVDLTKPSSRIASVQQGANAEAGQLTISWQADDRMLAARPISLAFSQTPAGPWLPIASGLENTGRYAWKIDNRTPATFYLRLEVRDEAGNVAVCESTEPVAIDQSQPTVRVREIRAVDQSGARSTRQR